MNIYDNIRYCNAEALLSFLQGYLTSGVDPLPVAAQHKLGDAIGRWLAERRAPGGPAPRPARGSGDSDEAA